jgi:hypothetical protein
MLYGRLLDLFKTFIETDFEGMDIDYMRWMLIEQCGMTNEEVEELGFGYILKKEREE